MDLAFNAEVDGTREFLSHFSSPSDLQPPEQQVVEPTQFNVRFVRAKTNDALMRLRRHTESDEIWVPPPPGTPTNIDDEDGLLSQLGIVSYNAAANFRGEPYRAPALLPVRAMPENSMDEMLQGQREAELLRSGQFRAVAPTAGPGDATAAMSRVAAAVGRNVFRGDEFWKTVWVEGGAGIASGFGMFGDYDRYRTQAEENWNRYYAELPRAAKLLVEETSPANIGLVLVGGPASNVLTASKVRGASMIGNLLAPIASNPIKAVPLEILASASARGGYEATEGAPLPVRGAVALAAGVAAPFAADSVTRGAGRALRSLDDFLGSAPTGYVDPSRRGQLHAAIFPGLTPEERAAEMAKVREAFASGRTEMPGNAAPKARELTPDEFLRLDYESAQEDLVRYTRAQEIWEAADWSRNDTFDAVRSQLAEELDMRDLPDWYDEEHIRESIRDSRIDVRESLKQLQAKGLVEIKDVAPAPAPGAMRSGVWRNEDASPEYKAAEAAYIAARGTPGESAAREAYIEAGRAERGLMSLADSGDIAPVVGFARANDVPPALRAAVGDGGMVKVGHADEMLDPVTEEIINGWRGDTLNVFALPKLGLRGGRPAGSPLIPIPDVIPVARPGNAANVASTGPSIGGINVAGLQSSSQRAADLAAQGKRVVPTGIMHSIQRAEVTAAQHGNAFVNAINSDYAFDSAKMRITRDKGIDNPVIRTAILASRTAGKELAARTTASRAQFIGQVKKAFGSTDRLPESIEYIGPALRPLAGQQADAMAHPLTGTIRDFFENPSYYNVPVTRYLPHFINFDNRNSAFSKMLESEFGITPGEFDTGIAAGANGGHGIFFPNYDAGIGRVARGHDAPPSGSPGGSFQARTYQTMTERLAEADQVLTEPVTDLAEAFARLDQQKIGAAQIEAFRYAVGGSRTPVDGWQEVPALATADGRKTWLPPEEAGAAANWLTSREVGFFNFLEDVKNTNLGGDTSPLTIQGSIGWALSPLDAGRDIIAGLARGIRTGDPLRPFKNDALFQDMAAAPDRWVRFFTHTGFTPAGGTPAEWRTGFLEKIPFIGGKLADVNDGISNALIRGMEAQFNEMGEMLIARGVAADEAWSAASDVMKMGWLQQNFDELGVSLPRRSIERGLATSATFVRQPVNFMQSALTGYAKLASSPLRLAGTAGQWTQLTPREQLAAQFFAKMMGTFTGISAISSLLTAEERGWSPEEALRRNVLDINGPDWMTLWVSKDIKIPVGGPYRSIMRLAAPSPIDIGGGREVPVPFAGVINFAKNRLTTVAGTGVDLIRNEDFERNAIWQDDDSALTSLAKGIAYAGNQVLPVWAGLPYESYRSGAGFREGLGQGFWQFWGQNPLIANEYEVLERERRLGARALYDMPLDQKVAVGLTTEQAKAATSTKSLAELRRAIGSRAANAATEFANPRVAGAQERYIADLRRRADLGDDDAEALLVSVDTQEKLQGLAQLSTVDGVLDKTAYRLGRGQIVNESVGRSSAFAGVFEKFRTSDSLIDRYSSEWYDLFEKATTKATVNGREVTIEVDFEAFNQLEEQFFASLPQDIAILVQQNVAVAPSGAGPAEVELREVRRDLTLNGYWKIDDELWKQAQPVFAKTGLVPEELVNQATSFTEYRTLAVQQIAQNLQATGRFEPATALQFAKSRFDSQPEAQAYDAGMQQRKVEWALQHAQDGLAERAIQWGYLSDSIANLIASGAVGNGQPASQPAPAAPAAPAPSAPAPSRTPSTAPEFVPPRTNPLAPRSENLSSAELTARLVEEHRGGASYGQLAIKYDITRDAAIGRIRRAGGNAQA